MSDRQLPPEEICPNGQGPEGPRPDGLRLGGLMKCSTIDFPGSLSCVFFTKGCNLDCFYCHNRALLQGGGPDLSVEEAIAFLQKRRGLLDGVVVSGGEPTLQPQLPAFLRYAGKLGFRTKLDTNGQNPQAVRELLEQGLLDYTAVDFKAPKEDYSWVCGDEEGYNRAKETIRVLLDAGVRFEARTTLYPGLRMEQLKSMLNDLPPLPSYRLNFFRMPELSRREDALRLRGEALNGGQVEKNLPELKKAQPNIVY